MFSDKSSIQEAHFREKFADLNKQHYSSKSLTDKKGNLIKPRTTVDLENPAAMLL
jgi:hypothetical protein